MAQKVGMQMDWSDIDEVVQLYFDGLYDSDVEKLRKAFHPKAQVIGHFKGQFSVMSLDTFLGFVANTPPPSNSGESYEMNIVLIDQTGIEAFVKVKDLYLGLHFTDYLTLMKIDGAWKIIHKAFYHD